jgi:hypothetical protein
MAEDSGFKFKVQGSKFKVGTKNEGLLPFTAYCLPLTKTVYRLPFTIYDLDGFNGSTS